MILALSVATALSGCVPSTGLTGLTVRQGQVVALVRVCYYTADHLQLGGYEDGERRDLGFWEMDGPSADVDLGSLESVVDLVGTAQGNLTALGKEGYIEPVLFRVADLRELPEGSVLVDSWPTRPAVLTLSQFEDKVAATCG